MKAAKKLVLTAVVLLLALGTASAFAVGGKGHHRGPQGECGVGIDRSMMRQLDLTGEQKDQLKELRKTSKQEMKAKFSENFQAKQAERQAHQKKVQALLLADTFDRAAADELAKQMVEKQSERRVRMLEKQHQMLSVLTPEQKTNFVELQKERMQECGEKMKKHRVNKASH